MTCQYPLASCRQFWVWLCSAACGPWADADCRGRCQPGIVIVIAQCRRQNQLYITHPSLDKLDPWPRASLGWAGGHCQGPRDWGPPLDPPGEWSIPRSLLLLMCQCITVLSSCTLHTDLLQARVGPVLHHGDGGLHKVAHLAVPGHQHQVSWARVTGAGRGQSEASQQQQQQPHVCQHNISMNFMTSNDF